MKTIYLYLLSALSGLLLAYAWFPTGLAPLLFIALVPLLMVEQIIFHHENNYKTLTLFGCGFLAFLIWNIITTYWIKNASMGGAVMAIVSNTILMTIVFLLFHKVKKRVGEKWGSTIFICFWMTFEFMHLRWDLSWPWLTLGNGFANDINWIQWYEYTGVFGGSLWILLINCLIVSAFLNTESSGKNRKRLVISVLALLAVPSIISFLIKVKYNDSDSLSDKKAYQKVVVVQPNIDPYNVKFVYGYQGQLQKMLQLAVEKVDTTTDYLLFPETALTEGIREDALSQSSSLVLLKHFIKQFPKLKLIIGADTRKAYGFGETPSLTARKFSDTNAYYEEYNTAMQLDNRERIQIYHKSKLVPGVEKMPFPFLFKYFEKYALELGGTAGSLGVQEERTVFTSADSSSSTAPVICYESIYGEYVSEYITNGAQFISIITNDGWWGDTPGYKQHLQYGALRAIETRRWVARSANTGISCFINPLGEILQATDWWTPAVITQKIQMKSEITFYSRYGDYIARAAMFISLLLIIYSWLIRFRIIKK